jgi:hypothetical protein
VSAKPGIDGKLRYALLGARAGSTASSTRFCFSGTSLDVFLEERALLSGESDDR